MSLDLNVMRFVGFAAPSMVMRRDAHSVPSYVI
jgi:hypothetical protein